MWFLVVTIIVKKKKVEINVCQIYIFNRDGKLLYIYISHVFNITYMNNVPNTNKQAYMKQSENKRMRWDCHCFLWAMWTDENCFIIALWRFMIDIKFIGISFMSFSILFTFFVIIQLYLYNIYFSKLNSVKRLFFYIIS